MTDQELIDEFEHEAWCDTQNNISKVCNCMMGYPLEVIENLKETIKAKDTTIAELESKIEQSVDIGVLDELNETIKAKDATIKEARELLLNHIAIFESQGLQWCCKKYIQEAKAWLEQNK